MDNPLRELATVLGAIASYNDKGCDWSGHSANRIKQEQEKAQSQIEALLSSIERDQLPEQLRIALLSGAASTDMSGCYAEQVKQSISIAG